MNQSWKEKVKSLIKLIKNLSDSYGGDDIGWLSGYIEDMIKKYSSELDVPILAFTNLLARRPRCFTERNQHGSGGLDIKAFTERNKLS